MSKNLWLTESKAFAKKGLPSFSRTEFDETEYDASKCNNQATRAANDGNCVGSSVTKNGRAVQEHEREEILLRKSSD